MYLKVRSPEEEFPFYVDECLLERFPLYWYSEPVQILGMNKVNEESALMIDFHDQYVCTREPLSVNKLVRWEKDKEYVSEYLDTTTGGLKNFFKMKNERELSTSNVVKSEQGIVVNQPLEKKRVISVKRKRSEEEASRKSKVINLTGARCCGKEVSLEEVKVFIENQRKLHAYVGSEDLNSVWSEHYPLPVIAEEHFQSKADCDLIESVGEVGRAQFMQVYAARLLCLGRYEELKAKREADQRRKKVSS
ncbi:hypothetical protein PIB30_081405 [Stylosanthes scabra]|uniref:Uncharacterized protein n=1 Tax=Stylosanthes scabra TaxID=79078 RepID=A0ABU6TR92_9FABA|nr:hypothetical protein [Stylosanthes scabra]